VNAPARRAGAPARRGHFVLDEELLLAPPGVVVDEPEPVALPDGEVDDEPVVPLIEPEPLVELLPGVVVVPGDAEGDVERLGVEPTRSDSVRLQAADTPTINARAQRAESILFIVDSLLVPGWNGMNDCNGHAREADLTGSCTFTTTASDPVAAAPLRHTYKESPA
jgi:hypothetical protein